MWAALILGEQVTVTTMLGGLAVIACAACAVRLRTPAAPTTRSDHSGSSSA
jgi:drug/metabolite transporter (DMT)-like permease